MVERAVTNVLQLLRDESSRVLDVHHIRECLEKANIKEIAEKVFTDVAKCIKTGDGIVNCIFNVVSFVITHVLNIQFSGIVINVIRLIYSILSFISGTRDSFSIMSENKRLELAKKMNIIEEKLFAFSSCFDARSRDLKSFKEDRANTKGRFERLLDDINYKEIGMGFSGELEAIILRYKNVRDETILKSVGEILTVYVNVAMMRRMMQISILAIASDKEMENAITRIKKYMEEDARRRMDFLINILEPSHNNAIFLSSFNVTEFPHLHMFMKTKGFITEEQPCLPEIGTYLRNKIIALRPVKFQDHWMNSAFMEYVWSTSTAPRDTHAQFRFEVESDEDNIFFIKSLKWQTYIYMKPNSFLSQTSTRPNEEGMFKFLRLKNGNCLITVVKYPCRFIYMQDTAFGRIKGTVTDTTYNNGLPTEQHEWFVEEVSHHRNGAIVHILESTV